MMFSQSPSAQFSTILVVIYRLVRLSSMRSSRTQNPSLRPSNTLKPLNYLTCKYPDPISASTAPRHTDQHNNSVPIIDDYLIMIPVRSAVIHEALRIHPNIGLMLERSVPAGGATLHGINLTEGTIIGLNAAVIHRNEEIFGKDVESFRPERWIDCSPDQLREMHRNLFTVSTDILNPVYTYTDMRNPIIVRCWPSRLYRQEPGAHAGSQADCGALSEL